MWNETELNFTAVDGSAVLSLSLLFVLFYILVNWTRFKTKVNNSAFFADAWTE